MKIDCVKVGRLRCNCYILECEGQVLVIDPGDEFDKIEKVIGSKKVVGVIITHHHNDHDGAVEEVVNRYRCKVYDRYNLIEGINDIDNFRFEVIYTPGHKEDLISIYFKKEKAMFVGDFIFRDSIGRCDLVGGDMDEMIRSIGKIKMYPRDIKIYPGHGEETTLGYEMDNNIYFRSDVKYI